MDDPAVTLEIPTTEDVAIVMAMLEQAYADVQEEYEGEETADLPTDVARQGSLCMELWGQLYQQGYFRSDYSDRDDVGEWL